MQKEEIIGTNKVQKENKMNQLNIFIHPSMVLLFFFTFLLSNATYRQSNINNTNTCRNNPKCTKLRCEHGCGAHLDA